MSTGVFSMNFLLKGDVSVDYCPDISGGATLALTGLGQEQARAAHLAGVEFGDEQADGGVQLREGKEALIA
ncbi:hypothetical protein NKI97_31750 [Mesorhizobium sp. M0296]